MSCTPNNKSDNALGEAVRTMLINNGIETPMAGSSRMAEPGIESHVASIMSLLGLDLEDDSLRETPKRVAKMFANELFWGLDYRNFPKATTVENKMAYDQMVLERNITVQSTCEHHLLPILGHAHIAYIPNKKVLGLSKLNRIVEFFSRRPQIQERLTSQIAATLSYLLETVDVAVFIEAEHMCVKTRGVEDGCSDTATSSLRGVFRDGALRAEFFSCVAMKRLA